MSKVSRIPTKESYNITSNWLNKFARSLQKEGQIVEVSRYSINEKFGTIEEKMSDMKNRVGFENLQKIKKESSNLQQNENRDCGCGPECDCRSESNEMQDLKMKIRKILNYAQKVLEDRPSIKHMELVHDCRGLQEYKQISDKIEDSKFKKTIEKLMNKHNPINQNVYEISDIDYVPQIERHQFGNYTEDHIPSYYKKSD